MINPYEILGISQNASKEEIIKSSVEAMKLKKYPLQKIHEAQRSLLSPAKRLVADFLFPSKIKAKRPRTITLNYDEEPVDLSKIDKHAINSLI